MRGAFIIVVLAGVSSAGLRRKSGRREPAISRVLSRTTIHLGQPSPTASSGLPGSLHRRAVQPMAAYSPIWPCFRRGLPCRGVLPPARCALTAPFHPYRRRSALAVYFLWHFPWACALQALPGALPYEARTFLRYRFDATQRLSGRLSPF